MRNKGHTQLVRGGQTTQHWTRMATQVFKYSTSVAAAAFTITFLVLVAQNYEMDKVRLTGIYWIAEFNVEQRGTELRELNYMDLDGRRVKRTAGQIYADRGMRATYDLYTANAWRYLYFSLLPAAAAFAFTFAVFAMVGRSLKEEEHIRGARLVTAKELKAWSKRKWREYEKRFGKGTKKGPRYTLAGIEFPPNAVEAQIGTEMGLMPRVSQQFHWLNDGYADFDGFLAALSSRKRKAIRKERAQAQSFGGDIVALTGDAIQPAHWDAFWQFYQNTGARKWGTPYLTRAFFACVQDTMRDDVLLVLAMRDGVAVAGALNFIGGETLFGRYWGCTEHHPCLHFELCY